mgnify:CR=1 FL=1
MKNYKVTITEKLQMTVEVKAGSRAEAEQTIYGRWQNSEYILDAECFKGVDFKAVLSERERGAR